MLEQRIKGLFWGLGFLAIFANILLLSLYIAYESIFATFQLSSPDRSFIYLLSIPIAFGYSASQIRKLVDNLNPASFWSAFRISFRFTLITAVGFAFIYLVLKDIFVSRLFLLSYLPICFIFNLGIFYLGPYFVEKILFRSFDPINAAIVTDSTLPNELLDYVQKIKSKGIRFLGYFAEEDLHLNRILWLGKPKDCVQSPSEESSRIDIVYAHGIDLLDMSFRNTVDKCLAQGIRVQVYSNLSRAFVEPVRLFNDGNIQFIGFEEEPLQNPINRLLKRLLDLAVSIPICLTLLPLLIFIVWIAQCFQSPGKILYRQNRYGTSRKPFSILKFRTMHETSSFDESLQATASDSRVFPFGRWLRKTSLDEFPQFINVLRGDMSIVGPRPHLTQHDEQFEKQVRRYRSRHFVKPGITGLAQIFGFRGEITKPDDIKNRIEYDLRYISIWSLSLDLFIIARTIKQVLRPPKTAY